RQRAPEVGVRGGGVVDAAELPGGQVVDATAVEEAWDEGGARDPGGQDRPGGLPPVAQAGGIRRPAVPGVVSDRRLSLARWRCRARERGRENKAAGREEDRGG